MDVVNSVNKPVGGDIPKVREGNGSSIEKEQKLKKACADFEAILVYQLLKTMRQTVPKGGFLSGSHGKDTFEMMLDQKLATDLAAKGNGLGLQKALYQQLTRQTQKKD